MLHFRPTFSEVFIGYYAIIKGLHGQGLEFSKVIHTFSKMFRGSEYLVWLNLRKWLCRKL